MLVEKIYLSCLSHASYIVHNNNEAVVVDPQRDVDIYVEYLEENNLKLKYILETHLHADFVSGHLELSKRKNGEIVFSEAAKADFHHISVNEGDILKFGKVEISILETPGHTPESICYVMKNTEANEPLFLFSGDTLFAGDVGRPDLMDESLSKEILGSMLYDSLRNKVMTLPDDTKVFPAHGAGSSCGKQLLDVEYSTIGYEKKYNYALQDMNKEEFIEMVTSNQPIPPRYFKQSAFLNRAGLSDVGSVLENFRSLSLNEFKETTSKNNVVILDTRDPDIFSKGYIPGSLNIGLDGRYAEWVGTLLEPEDEIVFVTDKGKEKEAAIRASRVGFDNVIGYLEGGYENWVNSGEQILDFKRIDPNEFIEFETSHPEAIILDVRRPTEFMVSHLADAINIPLRLLNDNLDKLDPNQQYLIHCEGGYRSVIASSLLLNHNFKNIIDLRGGYSDLLKSSPDGIKLSTH